MSNKSVTVPAIIPDIQVKTCSQCGTTKPITEFNKDSRKGNSGTRSKCRACTSQNNIIYKNNNKEAIRGYRKKYRAENKQAIRETDRKYCANNRANVRAKALAYYYKNREVCLARTREYRVKYPDRLFANNHINNEITAGRILRASTCQTCGNAENIHGHHHDYSKPEDVLWVCAPCHSNIHNEANLELTVKVT